MRSKCVAVALAMAVLGGCAQQPVGRAPSYPSYPASPGYGWGTQPQPQPQAQPAYGQVGQVTRIERVGSDAGGGGAVIGGVVGAVVGRQLGNSPAGRNTGTLLGAVGGALIGHQIERGQAGNGAIRVSVQFDNGSARAFDYAELGDLRVGDRVRLDRDGQLYRY
jgi:outer membrane lipoprotein SlyB